MKPGIVEVGIIRVFDLLSQEISWLFPEQRLVFLT